jgi:hypothetical protein
MTSKIPEIRAIASCKGYGASRDGRIWRIEPTHGNAATKGKKLPWPIQPIANPRNKLLWINTYHDGRHRFRYIHRLVAEAWLGPCPRGKVCVHLDGKHDNRVENLAYRKSHSLSDAVVRHIRRQNLSYKECHKRYGLAKNTIARIKQGRSYKHITV